jgi:hypothetical protein
MRDKPLRIIRRIDDDVCIMPFICCLRISSGEDWTDGTASEVSWTEGEDIGLSDSMLPSILFLEWERYFY